MTDLTNMVAWLRGSQAHTTQGRFVRFHPFHCPEAEGTEVSEWDTTHDMSVITEDGARKRVGTFTHAVDATFIERVMQCLPELLNGIEAQAREIEALKAGRDRIGEVLDMTLRNGGEITQRALKSYIARSELCIKEEEENTKRLSNALRAIIERWDTPAWKDAEPTGAVIERARVVLREIGGEND